MHYGGIRSKCRCDHGLGKHLNVMGLKAFMFTVTLMGDFYVLWLPDFSPLVQLASSGNRGFHANTAHWVLWFWLLCRLELSEELEEVMRATMAVTRKHPHTD